MDQQQSTQSQVPPAPPAYDPSVYGASTLPVNDPRRRSPAVAAILSLMPGLGQVYLGYTRRGFVNIGVVACLIAFLASRPPDSFIGIASVMLPFFWLYNIIDAGRLAVLYNETLAGRAGVDLPEPVSTGMRGSVAGGVALVLFGVLLLSNTAFDLSLEWLEDWWPVALVAFGIYLIYRARVDRPHTEEDSSGSFASTEDDQEIGPALK